MDVERIASFKLFADLDNEAQQALANGADEVQVDIGEVLARDGDFAYRFFGIVEGLAAVTKDGHHLTNLGPGDVFGEIGVLSGDRRTANVVAITPMKLAALMAWDFKRLADEYPDLADRLHQAMEERLARG
jgi:CRP-like cAMP-binding protein